MSIQSKNPENQTTFLSQNIMHLIARLPDPSIILFNLTEMKCGCALLGAMVGQERDFLTIFDGYWQSGTMEGLRAYRVTPDEVIALYRKTVAFHKLHEKQRSEA